MCLYNDKRDRWKRVYAQTSPRDINTCIEAKRRIVFVVVSRIYHNQRIEAYVVEDDSVSESALGEAVEYDDYDEYRDVFRHKGSAYTWKGVLLEDV